jgi:rubrerythrin
VGPERGAGSDPLTSAVGAVFEGVTFFELARRAVADTRVKVTFGDLAKRKREQLERLESIAGPRVKDAAPRPGFYPIEAVSKVECYVCGFGVDTQSMPDVCPSCGAARYSFEKEIAPSKAWEIAGASARKSAALFRDLAARADGPARTVLTELARDEDGLAENADEHAAELRT